MSGKSDFIGASLSEGQETEAGSPGTGTSPELEPVSSRELQKAGLILLDRFWIYAAGMACAII